MVDGVLRVVGVTDGAVQFKDFILSGPSRIVVGLAGARSTMGSKTVAVAWSPDLWTVLVLFGW
jgi:hypothetical protein